MYLQILRRVGAAATITTTGQRAVVIVVTRTIGRPVQKRYRVICEYGDGGRGEVEVVVNGIWGRINTIILDDSGLRESICDFFSLIGNFTFKILFSALLIG